MIYEVHLEYHISRKSSGRPQRLSSFDEQPLSWSFKKSTYDAAMLDLATHYIIFVRSIHMLLRDDLLQSTEYSTWGHLCRVRCYHVTCRPCRAAT